MLFFLFTGLTSSGQTDSTIQQAPSTTLAITDTNAVKPDTVVKLADTLKPKIKTPFQPKPKKAGLYSAIIPGMGQIYNRQYWKVPIVYAAAAASAYFFNYNLERYRQYRKDYLYRLANPNAPLTEAQPYTTQDLKTLQDQYRRFLDLTGLLSAVGYTLQVIDAVAAAHLKNFDVSRDISMRFKPVIEPYYVGVGVAVNFK